jgi:DNA-binding response OmpR family regulator
MGTQSTLLCIHRDPGKLLHLEENGYRLLTATNGSEGLRLLMSRTVDAVVIEYHMGLLDLGIKAALRKLVCGVVVGVCASTLPTRGTRLG